MFLADSNTLIYASKERAGAIARWLETNVVYAADVSYRECLADWPENALPEKKAERAYLEIFFNEIKERKRYIETLQSQVIMQRAAALTNTHNIRAKDALIAAAAEYYGLVLASADVTRNFAPRLEKLTAEDKGAFRVRAYDFAEREAVFAKWNAEFGG